MIEYPSLEHVLEIHNIMIEKFGGLSGIRDKNLLLSALEAPKASFGGCDLYPSIFEKAAVYLYHLTRNHPFNLETAVRDDKVMQDFDSESLPTGGAHSQMVKGPPVGSDSGSKGCVNLSSPTAVSRFNDGNKRTAYFITLLFLEGNHVTIPCKKTDLEKIVIATAVGKVSKEQLAFFLETGKLPC